MGGTVAITDSKLTPKRFGEIVIQRLSKGFVTSSREEVQALQDIDLHIESGQFICLIGPSGCGKSTLLNILAGLDFPDTGEVVLDGDPIRGPSPQQGVVFQQYALFPWMTVWGNIEIGLRYQRVPADERRSRVADLVATVGLRGFERAYPKELSGGMKQRVAIARAYAMRPNVLLMDEPFGALDAQTKVLLQEDLLKTWTDLRRTVVFVTHDVDEAVFLAQRAIVFSPRPGRIVRDFPIELPYPRTNAVRTSTDFFNIRTRIWDSLYELIH
jgi:NitT/TauT family transport system ATP-binding protein